MSLWRGLGPSMPRPPGAEALRAGLGAGLGLVFCALLLWALAPAGTLPLSHPALIAPFGATAFLIFAVPNSPLAQPWPVVVGNTLAAAVALAELQLGLPPLLSGGLAVALAVLVMAAARAMHPPASAVALFVSLADQTPPVQFILSPVLLGSAALVLAGVVWNRATGRVYPFRQPPPSPHGTADAPPLRRHLPPPGALADLLARLRLDATIGVEDLTRLITEAEVEAATRPLAGLTAAHLMSRDLVTVAPDTPLPQLADLFRTHRFKTLPVTENGHYLGLVAEAALIGLADTGPEEPTQTARDLMHPAQGLPATAPAALLVQRLSQAKDQSVPVVQDGRLIGLVTRSDLIALLARPHL